MVQCQSKIKKISVTLLSLALILSGAITDIADFIFTFSDYQHSTYYFLNKDFQILGFSIAAAFFIPFYYVRVKVLFFFLLIWKISVLNINIFSFDRKISIYILSFLCFVYIVWMIRLSLIRNIKDIQPKDNEAYYIILPVHTVWGILKAIFIPWMPALYESHMACDGQRVWLVHHKKFIVTCLKNLDINYDDAVRIPIDRKFTASEYMILNGFVGEKAIPGLKDCRKLLVAGKV